MPFPWHAIVQTDIVSRTNNSKIIRLFEQKSIVQVKCEVIEKTSWGARDGRYQMNFVLKCCMLRARASAGI